MTPKMRAVILTAHGDFDKLQYRTDWQKPTPGENEALIRVRACGLNNTDVNTRIGWYEQDDSGDGGWGGAIVFPRIQGADAVGVVEAVGANADASLIGRRVLIDPWLRDWNAPHNLQSCGYFGSECDGGFAEYACVDYRNVHPLESDLSDAELAAFATAGITAEHMLHRAQVAAGERVLISGASGGVGAALLQLCRQRDAVPIALCRRGKGDAVRKLGAEIVLEYDHSGAFDVCAALRGCGLDGVEVVADLVGGDAWHGLINALARGGRYTCAGAIGGPMVRLDLRTFYLRNLSFFGATVTPPGLFADLVRYIEAGEIRLPVAAVYRLEELHAAQRAFVGKEKVGKIVVEV